MSKCCDILDGLPQNDEIDYLRMIYELRVNNFDYVQDYYRSFLDIKAKSAEFSNIITDKILLKAFVEGTKDISTIYNVMNVKTYKDLHEALIDLRKMYRKPKTFATAHARAMRGYQPLRGNRGGYRGNNQSHNQSQSRGQTMQQGSSRGGGQQQRGRSQSRGSRGRVCWACGRQGHVMNRCREFNDFRRTRRNFRTNNVNVEENFENEEEEYESCDNKVLGGLEIVDSCSNVCTNKSAEFEQHKDYVIQNSEDNSSSDEITETVDLNQTC